MGDIIEVIRAKYPMLTKKQREISDYMLQNPDKMCFTTLKELSHDVGVSEMTILNLCTVLGYSNYNEIKYEFRKYAAAKQREIITRSSDSYVQSFIPQGELGEGNKLFLDMCAEEIDNINSFYKNLDIDAYNRAAEMVCAAKRVVICGRGVSIQLANYMLTRLMMNGVATMVVDTENNDSLHNSLSFIDEDTLLIPISFPDYYFMTIRLAQFARKRGAKLLAITDSSRSDIAEISDMSLYCPTGTRLFLNTITAPLLAINCLTMAVSLEMNRCGRESNLSEDFAKIFENEN